jgi:hypothetical protein
VLYFDEESDYPNIQAKVFLTACPVLS